MQRTRKLLDDLAKVLPPSWHRRIEAAREEMAEVEGLIVANTTEVEVMRSAVGRLANLAVSAVDGREGER